jgi:ribosomal protein S18 acetylase RimI-like enzyme
LLASLRSGKRLGFAVINLLAFACAAVRLGLGDQLVEVLADHPASRWTEAVRAYVGEDFVRAADLLAEAGARPDEAEARLHAGGEQAARALAFYRSVGATRYVREAESLPAPSV